LNNKDFVLKTLRQAGKQAAEALQMKAPDMTGTELYAEKEFIPSFKAAVAKKNMLERKAGQKDGFVCKSSAGRVVRLIQNYDSTVFTQEPEDLPAQWRFVWSKDAKKALPFIALATSPYGIGDCCSENGIVHRSKKDGNVQPPSVWPDGWEKVTE
jgi:hypothetical protein